jgi:hypothetical protein
VEKIPKPSVRLIKQIVVVPRNKHYVSFMYNDDETLHTKKYDDMFKYLVALVPSQSAKIQELLLTLHECFVLFVKEKRIEVLRFDVESELRKLRNRLRQHDLRKIIKNNKESKKDDKKRFDKFQRSGFYEVMSCFNIFNREQ